MAKVVELPALLAPRVWLRLQKRFARAVELRSNLQSVDPLRENKRVRFAVVSYVAEGVGLPFGAAK